MSDRGSVVGDGCAAPSWAEVGEHMLPSVAAVDACLSPPLSTGTPARS